MKIRVTRENVTTIFSPRVSSIPLYNVSNHISTRDLIAMLFDQSVYNEVYRIIKSNSHLDRYMDYVGMLDDTRGLLYRKEIIQSIKNWTYSCEASSVHNINIKNADGKLRSLSIPSLKDIILQTAIKLLIEAELRRKEIFTNQQGYWLRSSVDQALHSVKDMKGVTWMIQGQASCFKNIDTKVLGNLLKDKLKLDRTLIGLINKLLKAGYMEYSKSDLPDIDSADKVPLCGIMSSLLFNIYLTSLDEFVDKLKKNYTKDLLYGSMIYYVRYTDEWVIGVEGPFQLAKNIQEIIGTFLREELKLETSSYAAQEKIKITHLGRDNAKFLGHYIRWPLLDQPSIRVPTIRGVKGSGTFRKFTGKGDLVFKKNFLKPCSLEVSFAPFILIPLNELKSKLIEKGFADDLAHPKFIGKYIFLSDYEIVKKYNEVLRRIMTFYKMAENYSGLSEMFYILELSLAHTLAAKHRSTLTKIFNKYGKPISVISSDSVYKISFAKPRSIRAK